MVVSGIGIKLQPWRPIFEKCPHLREKGGVLTEIWHIRNRLSRTVGWTMWEDNEAAAAAPETWWSAFL